MENLDQLILNFIFNPPDTFLLSFLRFLLISSGVLIIVGLIYFMIINTYLRRLFIYDWMEFFTYRPYQIARKSEKDWERIKSRIERGFEPDYKLAVIQADNMMEDTLRKMGYVGDSFGDLMEKAGDYVVPNIEEVKLAHKLCNDIMYDPDYRLSQEEARKAIEAFERVFIELQVIS